MFSGSFVRIAKVERRDVGRMMGYRTVTSLSETASFDNPLPSTNLSAEGDDETLAHNITRYFLSFSCEIQPRHHCTALSVLMKT